MIIGTLKDLVKKSIVPAVYQNTLKIKSLFIDTNNVTN